MLTEAELEREAAATGFRVEVLEKVIQKWIDTGDFHEGQFGYQ